jgi:DNA-binding winged helix-turn-helix (wHTH) protein/TolB-like protein/predicted Zn-dependent protease
MNRQVNHFYEFGPFHLDVDHHLLLREGQPVPLTPKAIETLLVLLANSGRVVDKRELMDLVWSDTFVEEGTLVQNIFTLRKALGDIGGSQHYIETVPRRGYCFVGTVTESRDDSRIVVMEERALAEITIEEQEDMARPPELVESGNRRLGSRRATRIRNVGLAASLGLAAIAVALWLAVGHSNRSSSGKRFASLAVLPFKQIGPQEIDEYLGLGIADALITRLGATRTILVRPTNSVRKYGASSGDPLAAGRELGVDAVLDGNLQKYGDRLRVTVQLLNISDGATVWSAKYDESVSDILQMQDSMSRQVASAVGIELTTRETQALTRRYTQDNEAYHAYLKGRYFWSKRTADSTKKAHQYYWQAIAIDPNYALAYAGIAEASISGWTIAAFRDGKAFAIKALEIDPSLPEAFTSKAVAHLHLGEWADAESAFARAIELDPDNANTHVWYSFYCRARGRIQEGITEAKRAVDLDPVSVVNNLAYGVSLYEARQYDDALAQYQKTLEIDPSDGWSRLRLAEIYTMMGRFNDALAEYQMAGTPGTGTKSLRVAYALALAGRRGEARQILSEDKEPPSYDTALVLIALGEQDRALKILARQVDNGDADFSSYAKLDPKLDAVRSDPRFLRLLRRSGLD